MRKDGLQSAQPLVSSSVEINCAVRWLVVLSASAESTRKKISMVLQAGKPLADDCVAGGGYGFWE